MDHSGRPQKQAESSAIRVDGTAMGLGPQASPDVLRTHMTGHGAKFGRKKEEAVAAVIAQRNLEEAARVIGVGVATLMRWQKLPEFQEALRRARREALSQTIGRLQQGSSAAATTLLKGMLDQNTPASTKVRAADRVMNHALKAMELEDVLERLTKLEHAAELSESGGAP